MSESRFLHISHYILRCERVLSAELGIARFSVEKRCKLDESRA